LRSDSSSRAADPDSSITIDTDLFFAMSTQGLAEAPEMGDVVAEEVERAPTLRESARKRRRALVLSSVVD
jgi:hypothetical protein